LDRLKSFVPAGDNPSYPDLLLSLRILQQTSERFTSMLDAETQRHFSLGSELRTIAAALRIAEQDEVDFHNDDNDEEDSDTSEDDEDEQEDSAGSEEDDGDDAGDSDDIENEEEDDDESVEEDSDEDENQNDEYTEYVRKSEVKARIDGPLSDAWFRQRGDDSLFNFDKLDRVGIPSYEPPKDGITYEPDQK